MQQSSPARIKQRDSFHKAQDPQSGLYLKFTPHRFPGRTTPVRVDLTTADQCTWFPSRALADEMVSKCLGASVVEISRCDR